jgi:hypothetical protein
MSKQSLSGAEAVRKVRSSHTLLLVVALAIYVAANHLIYLIEIQV